MLPKMGLYSVQKVIYQLKKDKGLQREFKRDAAAALAGFELTPVEVAALASGDLAALYKMGVHPLLCAPYSRFMGIARPKYQELLAPLQGQQRLRS
jgi:Aromatic-ring-opening dioxygenase LigAB, LigA subunit